MSNTQTYTLFVGYNVYEKYDYIKELEYSKEEYYAGIPDFSLNYINNKVGYKLVNDSIGREELWFGIALNEFDEYEEHMSAIQYDLSNLESKYKELIDKKYYELFKEKPKGNLKISIIFETI